MGVTPSVFDPELASVTVAETTLSDLREDGSLVVGGYPIEDLAANATYEEAVYLLLHGRLPTADERRAFRTTLAGRRAVGDAVRDVLEMAAVEGKSPMAALRLGAAAADLGTELETAQETAQRLVAVFPTLVATYWRYRQAKEPVDPRRDLGHAANYLYMLTGTVPSEVAVDGLETLLTTLLEHGLNPSTFTARVVVSTEADLVSAVTAAVGTLKGPRHGGRLDPVAALLAAAHESDDVEGVVRDRLDERGHLPGFGHRVYRVRDPRAAVLSAAAERFYEQAGDDGLVDTVRSLEQVATDLLADHDPGRTPRATVEFYAAALLRALSVPRPLFPATFAVARVGGWVAHCREQLDSNHLIRPVARYVGETADSWPAVEHRHEAGDSLLDQPPAAASLEPVSETLATISEPNRLEILLALAQQDGPVAYSTLRDATSIDDKGRFNYHLRQLRGVFVHDHEDGYVVTDAGETLVHTVLTDDTLLQR